MTNTPTITPVDSPITGTRFYCFHGSHHAGALQDVPCHDCLSSRRSLWLVELALAHARHTADEVCTHGHAECSTKYRGPCFDEYAAGLTNDQIDALVQFIRPHHARIHAE